MTSAHRTAVIYGDTLFLEGIAEILHSLPELDVIERKPIAGSCPFAETQPDVVLIDAAQISLPEMEQLIESFPTQPCPPFVRLSADGQQLCVHSAQNLPAVTLADLTQALEKICNP
jgi:DNA-binding NarL/FixJ family response regulator